MARKCQICGKTSQVARRLRKLRGKYNPTPKFRKYPNLQWLKVPFDVKNKKFKNWAGKRVISCTKCIKTLAK